MPASLEALQALIDDNDQPVFALDLELRYSAFNRAHAEVMRASYGAEIALGGRILDYQTVASDRETAAANLERALAGERVTAGAFSGDGADRRYFDVVHCPLTDSAGVVEGVVVRTTDVTARRRAEEELGRQRGLLAGVVEGTSDAIYVKDTEGRYLLFNRAAERITGKSAAETLGRDDTFLFPAAEAAVVMAADREVMAASGPLTFEEIVTDASGRLATFLSTKGPLHDADGRLLGLFGVTRDITDRQAAESALRQSEANLAAILESTADGILAVDATGRVLVANRRFAELWRVPDALLARKDDEALLACVVDQLSDPDEFVERVRGLYASAATAVDTLSFKDGRVFERHSAAIMSPSGVGGRVWSFSDITDKVRAQVELQERERTLSTLLGNLPGMAYRCENDAHWTMRFVSGGCEELTGYPPEALVGNAELAYADLIWPEDSVAEDIWEAVGRGEPFASVYRISTASGAVKWVSERGVAVPGSDGTLMLEGIIMDVTREREAEVVREAAAAEWRRTFDAMGDSVALFDGEGRLVRCNRATAELIGLPFDGLVGRRCYEVFHGADDYHERCPQRRSFISGRAETSVLEQDGRWLRITFDPELDEAGAVCGGIHVASDVTDLVQAEQQARESAAKLGVVTEGVIAALSRSVETRDPYTSGHERRVSELATAIARELGFDDDGLRCVRIAGLLHDIGKIGVPAEILSKPSRLSEMEFALVMEHARAAYDILVEIEFSCPIADVVLQHHERLDGSGYPRGIRGEAILLDARILAVADVMEAMVSHRPYRPALPEGAAIAEIEGGAGRLYDRDVCEVVLSLFRDKRFEFSA
jgi:PAS domain S-box-containing protein/putative nucleotidyltransferase with HDIG domain